MDAALRDTAPAKINLTLRVVGRRADGYHDLDSVVAFADLADELSLDPADATTLDVTGPFAGACGLSDTNLVIKAARAVDLPAGRFSLDKRIPVAAGLGGGSSDAAAALRLIARRNGMGPDHPRIVTAARATGADVPVCLDPRPRIMRGVGDDLSAPLALPSLPALLVNPRVAVATAAVFAGLQAGEASGAMHGQLPAERRAVFDWLLARGNDLTAAAVRCAPVIADVLSALAEMPGCRLARMSGSGATCFALFDSPSEVANAAKRLTKAREGWWICPVTLR